MNDLHAQVADGSVLVTVNQRLARHHLMRYQDWQLANGRQCWETPAILPLRAWLRTLHAAALAAGFSSRTLLPDLLQQRAWRSVIEQDSNLALLDIEAATSSARSAWDLACAWQCHNPEEHYLSLDQYTWQRWCSRYRLFLQRESCVDDASLAEHLMETLTLPGAARLLPSSIILEGFLELPPQLELLCESLSAAGVAVHRASHPADAQVHVQSFADDDEELLSIAMQMRHELERDASQSLGLVVPDLQKMRLVVMRAFDRAFFPGRSPEEIRKLGRPFDLSLGIPLQDVAAVMAGLTLLKLVLTSIQGSELSAVLLSPYLRAAGSEARRREQLDRRLRDERVRSLTLEEFQGRLYPGSRLNRPISQLLKRRRLGSAPLSTWASRFSDWLSLLGWPGEGLDSEEYQAVSAWLECLDDMELLDDGQALGAASALQIVQQLARERIFQVDTPATPIQIMGRLESHGIHLDCLWVAGLDAEQWPPAGSPNPYLSIDRQKAQGVPDASALGRLKLAEREYLMWSSQAPLLIASHAQLRDGKTLAMAALPTVPTSDGNRLAAASRLQYLESVPPLIDPVRQLQTALRLERLVDDHGPTLPEGSELAGGARLFESQALCPFRAFALHRLQIRPLEEAGLGLDPRQHGTLLHRALELFWRSVRSHQRLVDMDAGECEQEIGQAVDTAIDELSIPVQLQSLERTRVRLLLHEWLARCEAPRQPFHVVDMEQRQSIEHGGVIVNVMLDRIDRVGDVLVVVDYKTGTSNSVNTWSDPRIVNPQLPLYVLTNDEIQGAGFAQVARNQCGFKGVASDADLLPGVKTRVTTSRGAQATERALENWDDWRRHWREALDVVAAELRQGLATVTPMTGACRYCELKPLCRIDEVAQAEADEESTDQGDSVEQVS
ncbi:MAG: hypothetical protein HKN42_10720 [Granulosicoccus sp.]|nr:hypothetical protein [Granulosicoccus sp.]